MIKNTTFEARALLLGERINTRALAKNLILELYEEKLSAAFDQIEPMAQRLHSRFSRRWRLWELTDQIGLSLLTEQRMVGRVEIKEKPEVLWEHPQLEGFLGNDLNRLGNVCRRSGYRRVYEDVECRCRRFVKERGNATGAYLNEKL